MRPSLNEATTLKKINERFSTDALMQKTQSGRIMIFSALNNEEIIATIVVNLHATDIKSSLDKTAYLSDFIVNNSLTSDEKFNLQFMVSVMKLLAAELPNLKILTLMAPGTTEDPLVNCIEQMKEQGLLSALDKSQQIQLGLIAYFVQSPQNKLKQNVTNTPANMFHRTLNSEEVSATHSQLPPTPKR